MNKVRTAYQDRDGRDVCGGCGSYYVVTPEEAKAYQEMYETLRDLRHHFQVLGEIMEFTDSHISNILSPADKALAHAEGRQP